MTKINISKKDVERILELMEKFPKESNYTLEYYPGAIGYTIEMVVPVSIKGILGDFKVEITDPGEW